MLAVFLFNKTNYVNCSTLSTSCIAQTILQHFCMSCFKSVLTSDTSTVWLVKNQMLLHYEVQSMVQFPRIFEALYSLQLCSSVTLSICASLHSSVSSVCPRFTQSWIILQIFVGSFKECGDHDLLARNFPHLVPVTFLQPSNLLFLFPFTLNKTFSSFFSLKMSHNNIVSLFHMKYFNFEQLPRPGIA